jgi:uncharacterized protein (DUF697 family)
MMDWTTVVAILIVFCIIGLLMLVTVLAFAVFYVRKQLSRYLVPNPLEIARDLDRLARTHGQLSEDALAHLVIKSTAIFVGVIGFVTGLGGIFVAIIGLPFDLAVCTRRQMKMVQVITAIYGNADLDPDLLQARYVLLVTGGAGAGLILKKAVPKLLGEAIPFLGAFVGFGFNWASTQSIGRAAIVWNRGETLKAVAAGKYRQLRTRVHSHSLRP